MGEIRQEMKGEGIRAILIGAFLFFSFSVEGVEPKWDANLPVPEGGRANPYLIKLSELESTLMRGKLHALQYPVLSTEALLPLRPFQDFFDTKGDQPIRHAFQWMFQNTARFESFDSILAYLGLPLDPEGLFPSAPLGLKRVGIGVIRHFGVNGVTVSCAGCHSDSLFGKTVLGMSNRFPKENEFFHEGKKGSLVFIPSAFTLALGAESGDEKMYRELREALKFVGTKAPLAIGLDTSLTQVTNSLDQRGTDSWASKVRPTGRKRSGFSDLGTQPWDSKPAPWWTLKYKNRFLLDGSMVSGNPILTNFIWNEIGRGGDLRRLSAWIEGNSRVIKELTTLVFSTESPKYIDYFGEGSIDLEKAKRGEKVFIAHCSKCHGSYEKGWNGLDRKLSNASDIFSTLSVKYSEKTKVRNVGTDPGRYQGMKILAPMLNSLEISKQNGIFLEAQEGYVPPPLVGIWARFPYFHNNSVPNLCELLTPEKKRVSSYYSGRMIDRKLDFDWDCVGYPMGEKTPRSWRSKKEHLYEAGKAGLSNQGHSEGILTRDGVSLFNESEKSDLIEFLKSL